MRMWVFGAGAIGGLVGAHLARDGHDVTLVDVNHAHVAAVAQRGLHVSGIADFRVPVKAVTPDAVDGRLDAVLLAVRARHTLDALTVIAPHLAADGYVVSLQNGMEEHRIAHAVGESRTIGALVTFGGHYAGPGQIVFAGRGTFCLGELDRRHSARTHELARVLRGFHPVHVTDNITGYLWSKEAISAFYFATALADTDVVAIIDRREHRPVLGRLVAEVVAVARAGGHHPAPVDGFDPTVFADHPPNAAAVDAAWEAQRRYWADKGQTRTGVWRDLAVNRRPTEVEDILVPITEQGRALGVPTPGLDLLIRMVREAETGRRPLGPANLNALRRVLGD